MYFSKSVSSHVKFCSVFYADLPTTFLQQVPKVKASLFVCGLLKHKYNAKWEARHISGSCTQKVVSDFTSLCVLQVFISACRHEKSSPETLSEMNLSLVVALRSRDVPLRRWLVSLLFPRLALKASTVASCLFFNEPHVSGKWATFRLNNISERFIPVCHTKFISYACPTFVRFHCFYISMSSALLFSSLTCHLIIRHILRWNVLNLQRQIDS